MDDLLSLAIPLDKSKEEEEEFPLLLPSLKSDPPEGEGGIEMDSLALP